MPIEDQKKLLINLKLPIAALVESGGKSVHAVVKIGASNEQEFKQRVTFLFSELAKRNFIVDTNNSNPSRLSRLPGAMRKGKCQKLIATNIGCASWEEWIDELNGINDNLPEIHSARDMFENPAPEPPAIIDGVLRQGAKMICSGDSKSGKTCLLTNLAICIAEGWEWLGHQCMQGKVLYINMEVMQSDFEVRYKSVYKAYGKPATEEGQDNFDYWNLRGKAESLEKLAPKIIRRCRGKSYLAIIVDPIYKVQGGDENSAEAIGRFCALFDQIAEETGASMIYVHHHAKGAAGGKKAMDRMSGSGVFARDADAIIDFSSLVLDPNDKEMLGALTGKPGENPIPLRLEMVLRSFRTPEPLNLFFEFPLHVIDSMGFLANAAIEGSAEANRKLSPNNQRSDNDKKSIVDECFDSVAHDGTAKFKDMYNSPLCEVSDKTLRKYIGMFPGEYEYDDGVVRRLK
jgi:RecA-family ATPase